MADENSAEYYLKREEQERALATTAIDPSIRKIHLEMAVRYAKLANSHERTRPKLLIVNPA